MPLADCLMIVRARMSSTTVLFPFVRSKFELKHMKRVLITSNHTRHRSEFISRVDTVSQAHTRGYKSIITTVSHSISRDASKSRPDSGGRRATESDGWRYVGQRIGGVESSILAPAPTASARAARRNRGRRGLGQRFDDVRQVPRVRAWKKERTETQQMTSFFGSCCYAPL